MFWPTFISRSTPLLSPRSPSCHQSTSMARGIPNYGDDSSYNPTGGGRQCIKQSSLFSSSSYFPHGDSFYYSSLNSGSKSIGDVFFGTDDIMDSKDLKYEEDVFNSYRREVAMKTLKQRSKKRSISNFWCVKFVKHFFCCCFCV